MNQRIGAAEIGRVTAEQDPKLLNFLHGTSSAISSMQKLQRYLVWAEGQSRVGDFLRLGNDAIQPLEKSASKSLICRVRNFGACGLRVFDAGRGREKSGPPWITAKNMWVYKNKLANAG
jgi:hypothetical protein